MALAANGEIKIAKLATTTDAAVNFMRPIVQLIEFPNPIGAVDIVKTLYHSPEKNRKPTLAPVLVPSAKFLTYLQPACNTIL